MARMMPFVIPFLGALVLPFVVVVWGAARRWPPRVALARVALAGYLALLAALTLTPSPFHPAAALATQNALSEHLNLVPLRSIGRYLVSSPSVLREGLLGNVAAFVPFGMLAPLVWSKSRRWQVLAAGIALSAGIEVAQYLFVPARVADVDDVLLNALGTALGLALVLGVAGWATRRNVARGNAAPKRTTATE